MELNKSLIYKIQNERYAYTLTPKDLQNTNIEEQETIIKRFFDTFNITVSMAPVPKPEESSKEVKPARKSRNSALEIWNNIKQYLEDEFTADEYWNALKKAGYEYKESTKQATPYQQTAKLIIEKKIERVANGYPIKWKKLYMKVSEEGTQQLIESLKEGKKVELGVIH